MGLLSRLTGSAVMGAIKGFGGIATDLRKMRLDAEVSMAQTKSAERREELKAEIEIIDRLVTMNGQAADHMQHMMKERWMKMPMAVIMWNAALWITAGTFRGLYGYGGDVDIGDNISNVLMAVIFSMFGLGASVLITNRRNK